MTKLRKIKHFWLNKLKFGEKIYFGLILIIVILTVYIAHLEINKISNLDEEIGLKTADLEELKEAKKYEEYLNTQFSIFYSVGRSLDSQRKEIELDPMGRTSIDLNNRTVEVVLQSCFHMNSLFNYLNDTLDCTLLEPDKIIFDQTEFRKMNNLKSKLSNLVGSLKKEISLIEADKDKLVGRRNFFYILLVVLSGIGVAGNYLLDKYYSEEKQIDEDEQIDDTKQN